MSGYYRIFSIAGISIRLETDVPMKMTDVFEGFLAEEEDNLQYTAIFREVAGLCIPEGECVYQEGRFLIYRPAENEYARVFREDTGDRPIYAVSTYDFTKNRIEIQYAAKDREKFSDTQKAFLHIAWEWILMKERRLMLHASCVQTPFGGILFSGPSGVGKSTQGDLWCRYGKGKLINGDKTILGKIQGAWTGYGSPYAGSSECYVNEGCPVAAVFFLKQGETCSLRRLNVAEGFKKIYTGLTINHWDRLYVERASELAYRLAMEKPVYEFVCTPDKNAVRFLQQKLQEGALTDE